MERAGALPEALEDIYESLLVNASTIVGDGDFKVRVDALEAHLHLAALQAIKFEIALDRRFHTACCSRCGSPVDEVSARIDHHLQRDRFGVGSRRHTLDRGAHDLGEVGLLHVEAHLAELNPQERSSRSSINCAWALAARRIALTP